MRADDAVKKQLATRLKRLRRRVTEAMAEIAMVERLIADVENKSVNPSQSLRKNGVARLTVQSAVRLILKKQSAPMRARDILDALRKTGMSLKSSTFRSHLKRMVDAGIISTGGARGYYNLIEEYYNEMPEATYLPQPEVRISYSYE